MERKEVITTLEDLKSRCPKYIKEYQALGYAISSVKTDEAYQLEYEDRDCVEVIRCKDCKYFEYDTVAKVDGVPLIVGHEMCNKWGEGCKTSENGYCFLAETKD
jgi:hypothetical protein